MALFHDGSALPEERLRRSRLEMRTSVEMRGGGRHDLETKEIKMSENPGVWEVRLDLRHELGIDGPRAFEQLNNFSKCPLWGCVSV